MAIKGPSYHFEELEMSGRDAEWALPARAPGLKEHP